MHPTILAAARKPAQGSSEQKRRAEGRKGADKVSGTFFLIRHLDFR